MVPLVVQVGGYFFIIPITSLSHRIGASLILPFLALSIRLIIKFQVIYTYQLKNSEVSMNTWEQWMYFQYNCPHPIREIVDRVKEIDSKGVHEYDNIKCMSCNEQWRETK